MGFLNTLNDISKVLRDSNKIIKEGKKLHKEIKLPKTPKPRRKK